ncbi:hypothetical protein [Streptomyces abyssomicinicus]|uniref:hypothetical protein n=1 Tax=Streptomyces abyssomicinicus TaxID=574929 RepID=UPI0012502A22|nr:hypothetical protein [Streptomyces abyssomicinicus]
MSLLVNVTLDAATEGGVGSGLASWLDAALSGPLTGCLDMVQTGTAWLSAASQRTEDEKKKTFALDGSDGWHLIRQELLAAPEWSSVLFFRYDQDRPSAHVRGSSITSRRPNMNLQLWLGGEEAPTRRWRSPRPWSLSWRRRWTP